MFLSAVLHDISVTVSVLPVYVLICISLFLWSGGHIYKTITKVYALYLILNL